MASKWGKQLWATEFSNLSSSADTITESIIIATLIHKHLTVPESKAFIFWWGATNVNTANRGEGLIYFDATGTYTIKKRLWAMGQFARFIRPGW